MRCVAQQPRNEIPSLDRTAVILMNITDKSNCRHSACSASGQLHVDAWVGRFAGNGGRCPPYASADGSYMVRAKQLPASVRVSIWVSIYGEWHAAGIAAALQGNWRFAGAVGAVREPPLPGARAIPCRNCMRLPLCRAAFRLAFKRRVGVLGAGKGEPSQGINDSTDRVYRWAQVSRCK